MNSDLLIDTAPSALLPVHPPATRSMLTRDGVRLDADIYRPAVEGRYPVLLQRQAYGRRIACGICYAHPSWYAAHGYIVVVQDVRGRGTSEGVFRPGEHEVEDGADAVEWAAQLEGSTGEVGMYGFSYQAYNQLLAAAGACPALKTMIPAMGPWDALRTWAYENGALRLKQMVGWGIQITAEAARRAGDAQAYAELSAAGQALPVRGPIAAQPAVLVRHRERSHFMEWIERSPDDPYWAAISPSHYRDTIAARRLPTLFIGGWFDTHLGSTLAMHQALAAPGDRSVQLLVGPWQHFPWKRKVGSIDFGPAAALNVDALQIRWFDHWLKGRANGVADDAAIRLFDMGAHAWLDLDAWPTGRTALHLVGSGRASVDPDAGRLVAVAKADVGAGAGADAGAGAGASVGVDVDMGVGTRADAATGTEYFVHDPWRPVPVTGGCYGMPAGPVDRSETDARGDVLTFSTAPWVEPLTLAGSVSLTLAASADQASFDLSCVLSRVSVQGQAFQLTSGYCHLPAGTGGKPFALTLPATCATLKPGERLRLSIAGASFPAYPVNPGTGESPVSTPAVKALITTIGVSYGPSSGSVIELLTHEASARPDAKPPVRSASGISA
jgi:predicted acyl esterase